MHQFKRNEQGPAVTNTNVNELQKYRMQRDARKKSNERFEAMEEKIEIIQRDINNINDTFAQIMSLTNK